MRLIAPGKRNIKLQPVHANQGLTYEYYKKLEKIINRVHGLVDREVIGLYRDMSSELTKDSDPNEELARKLRARLNRLTLKTMRSIDKEKYELGAWFSVESAHRSDETLRKILKRAGFSIDIQLDSEMESVISRVAKENVKLIKSIPEKYLDQVTKLVTESALKGRDLEHVSKELMERYNVARGRAKLIAHHQNNITTTNYNCHRSVRLGIDTGEWLHSHGQKRPRPSHFEFDGHHFSLITGAYLWEASLGKKVWTKPGELIHCACVYYPIVKCAGG